MALDMYSLRSTCRHPRFALSTGRCSMQRSHAASFERLVAIGPAADRILDIANELKPGLIVMGTHGHRAIARARLGSVAQQVVRDAPCVVVCVKAPRLPLATAHQDGDPCAAGVGRAAFAYCLSDARKKCWLHGPPTIQALR